MSPIFRNLGKIPEETAHVLQNLVGAKGLRTNETFKPFIERLEMIYHVHGYNLIIN